MLRLGPAALEGGGGGLHDDHVGAVSDQLPGQVGEGRLEAHQRPEPQSSRVQDGGVAAPPAVLDGGVSHAAHPAEHGPEGDVLAERDEPGLVVAAPRPVRPHQQRGLEDAAAAPPGVHVHQHVGAHRPGQAGDAPEMARPGGEIEAHAALPPDDQIGAAAGDAGGGQLVGAHALARPVHDARLDPRHHRHSRRPWRGAPSAVGQGGGHEPARHHDGRHPQARRRVPTRRHSHRDVDAHEHEAQQPHPAHRGQLEHGPVRPLAGAEQGPWPAQVLPGPGQLRRHPGAGQQHHGGEETPGRGRPAQQPPGEEPPRDPQGPESQGQGDGEDAHRREQPMVDGDEEAGAGQAGPPACLPPARGGRDGEEHGHQRDEGQPSEPGGREGQGRNSPDDAGQRPPPPPAHGPQLSL